MEYKVSHGFIDYKELNISPYFDYEVQKLCSVIASMVTIAFNKAFAHEVAAQSKRLYTEYLSSKDADYIESLEKAMNKGAMFDARCFSIPKEEVTNYFYWRQLDATRNSIQMVGQANFSHKELQNKSCNDIQNMLLTQRDINWNNLPTYQKRGSTCIKSKKIVDYPDGTTVERNAWKIDKEIPIFKNEGREYIERLINFD